MHSLAAQIAQARELLQQGWTKDELTNDAGQYCAIGAVNEQRRPTRLIPFLYNALHKKFQFTEQHVTAPMDVALMEDAVIRFNDAANRRKADVLHLFTRAENLALMCRGNVQLLPVRPEFTF